MNFYLLMYKVRNREKIFTRHFIVKAVHADDAVDRFLEHLHIEPDFDDQVTIRTIPIVTLVTDNIRIREIH